MGYPRAYRSPSRKYGGGGVQKPAPVSPLPVDPMHPKYTPPPKPANDPWPAPANDNDSGAGRWVHPPFPKGLPFPGWPAGIPERVVRRILPPPVRTVFDILNFPFPTDMWPDRQRMPAIDIRGWHLGCGPVTPDILYTGPYAFGDYDSAQCGLTGQAVNTSPYPTAQMLNARFNMFKFRPDQGRWQVIALYTRFLGSVWAPGDQYPIVRYQRMPDIPPVMEPEVVPATRSKPVPRWIPSPGGETLPEYAPYPGKLPRPATWALTVYERAPSLGTRPWRNPKPETVVINRPGTVTNPTRQPPGKGTKERKVRATGNFAWANAALGAAANIYEDVKFYRDILDAWYNAIPGAPKGLSPAEKAAYIYRHINELDVHQAVMNVLAAVAFEKGGAYIDRARRKASENLGLSMHITIPTGSAPYIR